MSEDAGLGSSSGASSSLENETAVTLPLKEHEELTRRAEERDAYRSDLLRVRADFDNSLKRMRKERLQWEEQVARRILRDVLPVCDNLERALAHADQAGGSSGGGIEAGVRMTLQLLIDMLGKHGVEEIPAAGQPFNPELHEAVSHVPADGCPPGYVANVLEKGYRHGDAVLRPSKVAVAMGPMDKGGQETA